MSSRGTSTTRAAFAQLPVMRKSELIELQKAERALRRFRQRAPARGAALIFASPGPIYEPEGAAARLLASRARAVRGGISRGRSRAQLLLVSLHARRRDAGKRRARARLHRRSGRHGPDRATGRGHGPLRGRRLCWNAVVSARSFSTRRTNSALRCRALRKALCPGEAFPRRCAMSSAQRGIAASQVYATADLGSIAYESRGADGLIVDEGVLVEIVRPGTGDPVATGEVGEVVVTLAAQSRTIR